jgi:2-dehydro-3-deoxygalactonokinase
MSADRGAGRLIALDWGTSSLRAYLLGDDGEVLEQRAAPSGILQVPERDFTAVFASITEPWRQRPSPLPSIACGMIGSAQGWIEAAYADAPADATAVAVRSATVPEVGLLIVPGVAQRGRSPDVMRGEETQLFGAMAQRPEIGRAGVVVLPGTHSKWVHLDGGRIDRFTTYMTGELFAVLTRHSILGRFAQGSEARADSNAFERGVRHAGDVTNGLASVLFSARAAVLVGDLAPSDSLEYLSGLLIGDEVRAGLASGARPAALIGDEVLCRRYAAALSLLGAGSVELLGDTAAAGLWEMARRVIPELQRADGSSRRPVSDRVH